LFSSVSSALGAPGQANYAAANAYLDALSHYRRAVGAPALTINWGGWSEVGMAARLASKDRERISNKGTDLIAPAQGVAVFEQLLVRDVTQALAVPIRWPQLLASYTAGSEPPILELMAAEARAQIARDGNADSHGTQAAAFGSLLDAAPESEKMGVIVAFVRTQVAKVLGLTSSATLAQRTPFTDLGLDSLMAVELRNGLAQATGLELRASIVFDHPCIEEIANYLGAALLEPRPSEPTGETEDPQEPWRAMADDLDQMSEQDLAALLSAGMASLKLEER
jgi:acyl carrier protein